MRTSPKLAAILLAATLTGACASSASMVDPVVSALAKGGLTTQQAAGGAGALLGLAQTKLPADQFSSLSAGVGGADKYMNQARNMTGETGPISSMSQVQGMFSKMGISPEQGAELTKNFGDFVGSKVGGPLGETVKG
ncbi:MAG: DUF2780 domain-containing protein, partial [Gemmatimonadales bacterium]